jgi:HAD superfamily hydrolase (TIGR01509 family)
MRRSGETMAIWRVAGAGPARLARKPACDAFELLVYMRRSFPDKNTAGRQTLFMGSPRVELVIFDCDGVIVDSELLSAAVLSEMMAEAGMPIDDAIFLSDFLGRSFANAARNAERRFGRSLPADFQLQYRKRLLARMPAELRAMEGVESMLAAMQAPFCLATSSSPQRLEMSLRVTGLGKWFAGRTFTASEVANGKPAPDLCLHAARRMATAPSACLVIEDSEIGIRAAQAANMAVWQFRGGAHFSGVGGANAGPKPDRSVGDMAELRAALAEIGVCSNRAEA